MKEIVSRLEESVKKKPPPAHAAQTVRTHKKHAPTGDGGACFLVRNWELRWIVRLAARGFYFSFQISSSYCAIVRSEEK